MKSKFHSVVLIISLIVSPASAWASNLVIKIEKGVIEPLLIGVIPFKTSDVELPFQFSKIISQNLERTGLFSAIPLEDMPQVPSSLSAVNFKNWRALGVENLIVGEIKRKSVDQYEVEFRLLDTYKRSQLLGYRIPFDSSNARFVAHKATDFIYHKLLGKQGAFTSLLAYITVVKNGEGEKVYRLQVADSDGYGARTIVESSDPLMSPAWSQDGKQLAYVSFESKNSAIYLQNLSNGKRKLLVSGKGINSAPSFSPDGTRIAMTLSRDGNPEIYLYYLSTGELERVTRHGAIDTEPSWSPDAGTLIFTSDRGVGAQIYSYKFDGVPAQRVTYNMGTYNVRGRYSPDGRKIALVHGGKDGYQIGVLDLKSNIYEILTTGTLDESPSFAPNGSMIIYSAMTGRGSQLAAASVDGYMQQTLEQQIGEVREPVWGPLIR
jgi:TolB protein